MPFNPNILENGFKNNRYQKQLLRIRSQSGDTQNIEEAVDNAINNINCGFKSFIIYGEPQSGKTEMMIALTAKLLDYGKKIVIVLLNDNVQLLNQNLDRFKRSKIDPTPKVFSEFIAQSLDLHDSVRVVFSKKNFRDLMKLIELVDKLSDKVVIDDEADYASPNSKINQNEKTKINELIEKLIGLDGVYIGVTATPARLDLNNTFRNNNSKWIYFKPPKRYHGQKYFFPVNWKEAKHVQILSDIYDNKNSLDKALFNFLINNAYLNLNKSDHYETNYSMLVHTSGKKCDHNIDQKNIEKTLNILSHSNHKNYLSYFEKIWEIANNKFPDFADEIIKFISSNINRSQIIVINSEHDKDRVRGATSPSALFTIAIGGNIVSRGVTFENLLTMFFTRDAKHKIQQDTYIQRARMFGYRGGYLDYFELYIPGKLYADWHKCFMYHKLSLDLIESGHSAPVWLEDGRISAVAKDSIDINNIILYNESMSFELFLYNDQINNIILDDSISKIDRLIKINKLIGEKSLPYCVIEFIKKTLRRGENEIALHSASSVKERDVNPETIKRSTGGIFSGTDYKKYPDAIHHIKVFYIPEGVSRLYYKYRQDAIKFLSNRRRGHDK